jgi:ABC-type transporter Mla MlaB component
MSAAAKVMQFGSSLSIREVAEYADRIKAMFQDGPFEIDLRPVASIDTAGLQLLLATALNAQRQGFRLQLHGAEAVRTGAARALGLEARLSEVAEILS